VLRRRCPAGRDRAGSAGNARNGIPALITCCKAMPSWCHVAIIGLPLLIVVGVPLGLWLVGGVRRER